MSRDITLKELRKLSLSDLSEEINALSSEVAKLRLGIALGKEKNTSLLKKSRRQLARMKGVRQERQEIALQESAKDNTVAPASKASA